MDDLIKRLEIRSGDTDRLTIADRWEAAAALRAAAEREKELREALRDLVSINEHQNEAIASIIGRPMGWKDSYLDAARAVLCGRGQSR